MKIRSKMISVLFIAWVAIMCAILADSYFIMLNHYKALEVSLITNKVKQINDTFDDYKTALIKLNADWSHWDDAYQFMKDKNQKFLDSNMLPVTTYVDTKTNLILFFESNGNLFYGKYYDLNQKKFLPLPIDLINIIKSHKSFYEFKDVEANTSGFVKTSIGYVLLSGYGISTSDKKGNINGAILMGTIIDNEVWKQLSETLQLKLTLYSMNDIQKDQLLKSAYYNLLKGDKFYVYPLNYKNSMIFTFFDDVNNNHIGILAANYPRIVFQEGIRTIIRYLFIIGLLGIAINVLLWFAIKFVLLNRLTKLKNAINTIKNTSDFSKKISITGNDELKDIANVSNDLFEIIDLTQNQLKHRLSINTNELGQLSKLNANLSSEISRHEVTEKTLEEQEKYLQQKAYYDIVTGLPNRIFFFELLQKAISTAERDNASIAVLFIDLDKFKPINDTYGHDMGDIYLREVGNKMTSLLRKGDVLARLGGDEFIFYIYDSQKSSLSHIIERILQAIANPVVINNITLKASGSIGVSIYPQDATTKDELIKKADTAMYFAKKQGGNCCVYYNDIKDKS